MCRTTLRLTPVQLKLPTILGPLQQQPGQSNQFIESQACPYASNLRLQGVFLPWPTTAEIYELPGRGSGPSMDHGDRRGKDAAFVEDDIVEMIPSDLPKSLYEISFLPRDIQADEMSDMRDDPLEDEPARTRILPPSSIVISRYADEPDLSVCLQDASSQESSAKSNEKEDEDEYCGEYGCG